MTTGNTSSTTRFSDRVQNYTRYRPSYPRAAVDWIIKRYHLTPESRVADIGSGTGIFSGLLISAGLSVVAVEPNHEMRAESDRLHSHNPLYTSVPGSADATLLDAASVDMIVAAQAFHWFNTMDARREFQRILRPGGLLVLIWNRRKSDSDFQRDYERVLQKLPEYTKVNHTRLSDSDIEDFFSGAVERCAFPNSQDFDHAGFRGRVFSSSYTPDPDDVAYADFSREIDDLFYRYATDDQLSFAYSTEIYSGRLNNS